MIKEEKLAGIVEWTRQEYTTKKARSGEWIIKHIHKQHQEVHKSKSKQTITEIILVQHYTENSTPKSRIILL